MIITAYAHASKESMWERGKAAGLTGKALEYFIHACGEVAIELVVDEKTGAAKIVGVNGVQLEKPTHS